MPKPSPDYRTDVLACPLNAGKLESVADLVLAMRKTATREASLQWRQFYERGWIGFESVARQGWSRPWVADHEMTTSHAQMVMAQVAASLQGHLGNVQNTYKGLVTGSSLPPAIRHQLHFINRKQAWFWKCDVALKQTRQETNPRTGKSRMVEAKIEVDEAVRQLARTLIRRALAMHRRPRFDHLQPQIDQRSCFVQASHTAKHDLWLRMGLLKPGKRVDLPLMAHPGFLARQGKATAAANQIDHEDPPAKTPGTPKSRNPHPSPDAIASTIRLILSEDRSSLSVCVATDMRQAFEQSRFAYQVKTPILALDLGLCTLVGTDQGDLLGRSWLAYLAKLDKLLTSIARHRQRLGLPVKSDRYHKHTTRLRGYLKTEINRIFNRLVQTHAPGHLILEDLDFTHSGLSRRLNRILRNFGQGLITAKLKELEVQYGITAEFRNPTYSSQQCHNCGYVDEKNRKSQSLFQCKFCNKKCHADVNAPRVVRDRRSIASISTRGRYRVNATLIEQVNLFNERYPRPRGGPADPRFSNPYFKGWAALVRSQEAAMPPSLPCALA